MAITTISQPRVPYNPAYNPITYVWDSNLKSSPGFRYIVEISVAGQPLQRIAYFSIAPRNGDGYGYLDCSGILKNYVDKALRFNSDYDATTNVAFQYQITVGEEYQYLFPYVVVRNLGGYIAFSSIYTHGLTSASIGAPIIANNTSLSPNSWVNLLNGSHIIRALPSATEIQTNTP